MRIHYDQGPNPYTYGTILVDEEGRRHLIEVLEKVAADKPEMVNSESEYNILFVELWNQNEFSKLDALVDSRRKGYRSERIGCFLFALLGITMGAFLATLVIHHFIK